MKLVQHVTDDTLERYAMKALPQSEGEPLELHLLMCSECRDRLDAEVEFVAAMHEASVKIRSEGLS